jgi:AcrR family transcriptional regulator
VDDEPGLRERKKRETRYRLGDVAARLFADRGYDAVSMSDVARAANVSEQTVYNYFPTKPDLVLDRDDEIRERLRRAVRDRPAGSTPADALREIVLDDIGRFLGEDASLAKGEFPALSLQSPVLRRFALESRERQTIAIASAILETAPDLNAVIIRSHAAALVSVLQTVIDRIGRAVLDDAHPGDVASELRADAIWAFGDLAEHFTHIVPRGAEASAQ